MKGLSGERSRIEETATDAWPVESRVAGRQSVTDFLFKDAQSQDGQWRIGHIVENDKERIVDRLFAHVNSKKFRSNTTHNGRSFMMTQTTETSREINA